MTTTTTPARLYPGEAAHLLGLPEATLERWAAQGRLTRHDEDGEPCYDADEVRTLIQAAPRSVVGVVALLEELVAAAIQSGNTEVWRKAHRLAEEIRGR